MNITESDINHFKHAIQLAEKAEQEGNLPVGAVITLVGKVIAEGRNAIWSPELNLDRHAEIQAMRDVPKDLWERSRDMTLYTTLEPCMMCQGAILLHRIGRLLFGSVDAYGGAGLLIGHIPPYFEDAIAQTQWLGPAHPQECDPLHARVMKLEEQWTKDEA